jgi:serine/threonine-protein kinase
VVHRIAFGGMAEIYLARAAGIHGFEKYVVLKRILPNYAANEEFVRMFIKEARLAAALDHANIAHVYDIGEADGAYFFTMEYLHGEDLRNVMRALVARGGQRMPLEQALAVVSAAAEGLHFAHEKKGPDGQSLGIVHRDMSPANVVVTYDGGVKIVDFGIAKITADPELSRRYSLKGKLAYMSPEQLHNRPLDRRSDVFALGIILFEITTGSRLFKGTNDVETMKLVLAGNVPPPSSLLPDYPPELERIVLCALEQDPERRYPSARAFQQEIEAFARDNKLRVSSASLADWMQSTFGPKEELWRSLALPSVSALAPVYGSPSMPSIPDGMADTRVLPRAAALAPSSAALASVEIPLHDAPVPRRLPRLRVAALGVAAALVAAGAWIARGRLAGEPAARRFQGTAVVVAAEQGHVAIESGAVATPLPAGAPAPLDGRTITPTTTAAHAAAPSGGHHQRPATARSSRGARDDGFSVPFARQEGEIRKCFDQHAEDAAGTSEISLRFQVGRSGAVTSVAALPAEVAARPLGACLVAVASRTQFAPQPEPVTFRIPLTLQVKGKGKPRL